MISLTSQIKVFIFATFVHFATILDAQSDASFIFSGTESEVSTSFSTVNIPSGISFYTNSSSFPNNSVILSSGSYLSTPMTTSLPTGSSPFTVSSWVKCDASSFSSSNSNRSLVAVSWGKERSSTDLSNTDCVILSVNKEVPPAKVTTLAGNGFGQFVDDGGNTPYAFAQRITADSQGNVYDCSNYRIRKVDPNGKVTHFLGNGNDGNVDGTGLEASISQCSGITIDSSDNIYIIRNYGNVRKVSPKGVVSTLSHASISSFLTTSLTVDIVGNIFVSTSYMSGGNILKFSLSGVMTVIGKNGGSLSFSFADGYENEATFSYPQGLASDKYGNVYVADSSNRRIRKISSSDNYVSTYAGNGNNGVVDGERLEASFGSPYHITIDYSKGILYIADIFYGDGGFLNFFVRKITPDGIVSTLAGGGQAYRDGIGTNALFTS